MAKDPAVLWYWGDWYSGTSLMSRFLKGCYMDLLHAQFNNGRLSLEEIKICLGSDFGQTWPALQKKFTRDDKGMYFNERLEREKIKRDKFCKSRSNNKSGRKKSYDKSHDKDMMDHMENENENRNENVGKEGLGEREFDNCPPYEQVEMYFRKSGGTSEMAEKFYNKYKATNWCINGARITNFTPLANNFISNFKEINRQNPTQKPKKYKQI